MKTLSCLKPLETAFRPVCYILPILLAALSLPVFAQSNMDHGAMHGGHGAQESMPSAAPQQVQPADPHADHMTPPVPGNQTDPAARDRATVSRESIYKRNPDGSYAIPGTGMAMADNDIFHMVMFDQLEYVNTRDGDGFAWDAQAWVGRDFNKLWLKTEGERLEGETEGRLELLGSRAVAAFWDAQVGVRHDFGQSPSRQWLAFGIQGIAPYWFDIEAFGYIGPSGRTAARFKADYTFRLSQVTFLTPEVETNLYGKSDRERGIGSGLSDMSFGLRLRYEIRREVAPYIGINWTRKFGETADFARDDGESRSQRQLVAGVRIWF
ncbi:copper resistance protein B [Oxalobacteraceae bacterium R-40]|uniref:Copper resistance protein B n=1 Tax=Keguizhuia sedimenti TaxID=3064264 RepID=A0ABU1BT77_9BURK|nr:copper resistance protein B [Oxalobacteraceae bacterium R-40]